MTTLDDRSDVIDLERGQLAPASGAAAFLLGEDPLNVIDDKDAPGCGLSRSACVDIGNGALFSQFGMPCFPALNRCLGIFGVFLHPSLDLSAMACRIFGATLSRPARLKTRVCRMITSQDALVALKASAIACPSLAQVPVLARLAGRVALFASRLCGYTFGYGSHGPYDTSATATGQLS